MVTVRDLVRNNEKYEVVWGEHNTVETMRLIVVPNTNAMGAFMFKVRRRLSAYNVQDSNTNILYAEVSRMYIRLIIKHENINLYISQLPRVSKI